MNKDYLLLKNLYTLLEAGYSIEETLHICQHIMHHPIITKMIDQLHYGESL